jgi:NADH:ubiquinone oxidoreductase subunit F (NADH-binding)/NADH:ubiquinone oxidoreductase subunit E
VTEHREASAELERRLHRPGTELFDRLRRAQAEEGGLTPEVVDAVAAELGVPRAHVSGAVGFFADLGYGPRAQRPIRVCAGAACLAASDGHAGRVAAVDRVDPVYCLGYCYAGPAALHAEQVCTGADLAEQLTGDADPRDPPIPWAVATDQPVVFARLAGAGPDAWSTYPPLRREGGRARVLDEVKRSGLRGRGGAGFPAAVKWTTAAESPSDGPRYLIANGDEGDPGSYVDRLLMEQDPHGVLEGMALAALAAGATHGYVYVRSEYPRARDTMRRAIEEARRDGHLGEGFDVDVFEGAGSYVAGEETALIHSMEGLRGGAAPRPPYPASRGLYGRPTVVNNVETLASIPWIVANGGDAYASLGLGDSHGTKVVCLNERFERPGAYEVELGTSVRSIVEDLGGGVRDGKALVALQVGGPLGGFLGPDELDVPLAFGPLREAGVELGHGSLIAFDDGTSPAELLLHVWRFAADESCGTCAPCRIGSRRGLELAERIADRSATSADRGLHGELLQTMADASLCAFGQSVPQPVRGLLRIFPELGGAR